jgi:hypothetical protein
MRQLNSMEDFRRDISYRVLKRDDHIIALSATLKDRFHDILAEVVVAADTLTIISARADFRTSPTRDCQSVSLNMERLIGFSIGKGLTRKLSEVLGGSEGCGNMRNLLGGLLPLALNVRASAGITDEQDMLDTIHEHLRGTCAGYLEEYRPPDKS